MDYARDEKMGVPQTWRQLLKRHGPAFLDWLDESGLEFAYLDSLATNLERFLKHRVHDNDHALQLWNLIPEVRRACNEPETFNAPLAAEAYAYVHLLERYRRTWAVLKHLTELAVLPLASQGVRTLDVGAGPAPSLYAVADFYSAVTTFAKSQNIEALDLPAPALDCIERSQTMVTFFGHFSECSGRRGPFGAIFADFSGIDFKGEREALRDRLEVETYWDSETETYEEYYNPFGAHIEASRFYRYRLVIFSNFMTLAGMVDAFEQELRSLFSDLNPGATVMILGGTGDSYQQIYGRLAEIAQESQLKMADWDSDELGRTMNEAMAKRIKLCQYRVYQHLAQMAGDDQLRKERAWPDYWTAVPSKRARARFALRVFRRGRWPSIGETMR